MFEFLPIGGVGYIGGNISYMRMNDTSFLIDTGILFPSEGHLGINHLYPDLSTFANNNYPAPEFLILTHVHEDHVGGIKYILETFPNLEIICSSYSQSFINKKHPSLNVNLTSMDTFLKRDLKIKFNFFNIRHSIPGIFGFFLTDLEQRLGVLFCTDFRFDVDEKDDTYLSPKKIELYKKTTKNRIAFIDSTNISSPKEKGPFEKDIYKNLESTIKESKQDTYIPLFPSNVKRLNNIIKIANKLNRPVCLSGFSCEFHYSLGLENGLMEPIANSTYSKGSSVILLSGSQGDLRGAFRRVFSLSDKKFKPIAGDKLLYSSKIIPGNEKSVTDLFNKAAEMNVYIDKGNNLALHASGHAYSQEIASLINFFDPQDVVPIHLERSFFQEFTRKISPVFPKLKIHELQNYKSLFSNDLSTIQTKQLDPLDLKIYLEGGEQVDKSVINNRRRLGNSGCVFVTVAKESSNSIHMSYYGLPDIPQAAIKSEISKILTSEWNSKDLQETLRIRIRQYLGKKLGFKPLVFVHLL